MNTINVGVIGCGYWGPKLARNFNEMPGTHLAWVSDLSEERLAHMRQLYPEAHTTQDYHEVLASDVQAVAIATPVSTHHQLAMEALQAGKNILVEKPLAATVAQATEIAETADRLGPVAMVGHTFQFNPAVHAVRDLIASGELGQVYYINATRVNLGLFQSDINVMWDLAPHDISILLDILGMEPSQVSASGGIFVRPQCRIHEVAYLNLHFPNGILANVRVSWLDPVKTRRITVIGSKKMLVYDDIAENKVILYDQGVDVPPYSDTPEQFQLSYRHGPETIVPVQWREPLRLECESFIGCIRHGRGHCATCAGRGTLSCSQAWVGVKVVRVLEAAQKSLLNGGGRELVSL
ncbi:MAG: Gfo/Idh/MocA family oxidoreductase [Chloroflexi bacterium]|nr:Gfo/Idh/MocA family oxidoreductase [Chloroflexota bacterium]